VANEYREDEVATILEWLPHYKTGVLITLKLTVAYGGQSVTIRGQGEENQWKGGSPTQYPPRG
jgi:hypothetical protein